MSEKLNIVGSTGSIGTQALEVVRSLGGRFEIGALSARNNAALLAEQVREFRPKLVGLAEEDPSGVLAEVAEAVGAQLVTGSDAATQVATAGSPDIALIACVGFAGVEPTLGAAKAGIRIALANKESLVCAGELITTAARESGATLLPVDSEHNALFQCLEGHRDRAIQRLILTASGGPFFNTPRAELEGVTRSEVLAHPTWEMGAKITVDSATMMNKGFEVLEAMWLFDMPLEKIEAVIHPKSVIHGLIEFGDGGLLAHLGPADMKLPIRHALLYPNGDEGTGAVKGGESVSPEPFDLISASPLEFHPVDLEQFPLLGLAYEAGRLGGYAPTYLNALNEAAIEGFLNGEEGFLAMQQNIIANFRRWASDNSNLLDISVNLETMKRVDHEARHRANKAAGQKVAG